MKSMLLNSRSLTWVCALSAMAFVASATLVPASAVAEVDRLAGPSRAETAAAASRATFRGVRPSIAVVASGENFPDALTGAGVAQTGGPILLVGRDSVPEATADELVRLNPERVVILGGTAAVSADVQREISGLLTSIPVDRVGGDSRFDTAERVAVSTFPSGVDTVIVVSGDTFPDAVIAGPLAAAYGAPILLANADGLQESTVAAVSQLGATDAIVIGGTSVLSEAVVQQLDDAGVTPVRVAGEDRFETAVALTSTVEQADNVILATAGAFPDALAGGPISAATDSPLLLTDRDVLPDAVRCEIARLAPERITILGGEAAVSQFVAGAADTARTGQVCGDPQPPPLLPRDGIRIDVEGGPIGDLVVAQSSDVAYVSNQGRNHVEVVDIESGTITASVPTGSAPTDLDLTVDGSALWVVNSGGSNLTVVDTETLQSRTVQLDLPPSSQPVSLAIVAENRALLTTTSSPGVLLELDLSTGQLAERRDYGQNGLARQGTSLSRSADRSTVALVDPSSAGNVTIYLSETDTFTDTQRFGSDVVSASVSVDGSVILISTRFGVFVTGPDSVLLGTIEGLSGYEVVSDPINPSRGYRLTPDGTVPFSVDRFLADPLLPLNDVSGRNLAITPDGTTFIVTGETSVQLYRPTPAQERHRTPGR